MDLTDFGFHLAVNLLGNDTVTDYFQTSVDQILSSSSSSALPSSTSLQQQKHRRGQTGVTAVVPLYWRSKLLIPDASNKLYYYDDNWKNEENESDKNSSNSNNTNDDQLLYFDITFDFQKKEKDNANCDNDISNSHNDDGSNYDVLVSFGFFFLRQHRPTAGKIEELLTDNNTVAGYYLSTQPLTSLQLTLHLTSLQLDPASVTAKNLANSMAEEFLFQDENTSELTVRCCTVNKANSSSSSSSSNSNSNNNNSSSSSSSSSNNIRISMENLGYFDNGDDTNEWNMKNNKQCHYDLRVDMMYKKLGDINGTLILKMSSKDKQNKNSNDSNSKAIAKFDKSTLRYLHWDIMNRHHTNGVGDSRNYDNTEAFGDETAIATTTTEERNNTNSKIQALKELWKTLPIPVVQTIELTDGGSGSCGARLDHDTTTIIAAAVSSPSPSSLSTANAPTNTATATNTDTTTSSNNNNINANSKVVKRKKATMWSGKRKGMGLMNKKRKNRTLTYGNSNSSSNNNNSTSTDE